uniref:Uncharacterized protein n=1 Tax=Meloidogyne hapla TaxID=6305 RepID=A0A1I8BGE2_MELHA
MPSPVFPLINSGVNGLNIKTQERRVGLAYDELNALNILKNAMEKRAEANRRLNEQLKFSSKQLDEAKEALKITRERIDGLESKCEMYGRLKKVLKDKLTELEYLIDDSTANIGQKQQKQQNDGWMDLEVMRKLRIQRQGLVDKINDLNNKNSENFSSQLNPSETFLCNNNNIGEQRIGLETQINQAQKRIQMLEGMEHKISVSLFLAKLL